MTGIRSSFVLLAVLAGPHSWMGTAAATGVAPRGSFEIAEDQNGSVAGDADVRKRAEDLAGAASERFTQILSDKEKEAAEKSAQDDVANAPDQAADGGFLAPVWDWLAQAAKEYRDVIIVELKEPKGEPTVATAPATEDRDAAEVAQAEPSTAAESEPAASSGSEPTAEPGLQWGSITTTVQEWLARANRSYRNEIVKKLRTPFEEPVESEPPKAVVQEEAAPPVAEEAAEPVSPKTAGVDLPVANPKRIADAQAKADADRQRLAEDAEAKRKAEAEEAESVRLAEAAEAKRKAEEEEKRLAEEEAQRKAEAEKQRLAEEAERKAAAERERLAKEEAERAAEAEKRRLAEAEAARKAEAERQRLAEEEAKRKAEAEKQRLAEEAEEKAAAERKRLAEAEAERKAAAERQMLAEAAEFKRKAEAERQRLAVAEAESKAKAERKAQAAQVDKPERKPAAQKSMDVARAEPQSAGSGAVESESSDLSVADAKSAQPEPAPPVAERKPQRTAEAAPEAPRVKKQYAKRRSFKKKHRRKSAHVNAYRKKRYVKRGTRRHCKCRYRRCGKVRYYRAAPGGESAYVVRRGDTLWGIARRYYGDGARYHRIYRANRGRIRNPNRIYVNQRIYVPAG